MRRGAHVCVGLAAGALVELLHCYVADHPVVFRNLMLAGCSGAICAALPDVLEPALHPNHRSFFHSEAVAVGASCSLGTLVAKAATTDWVGATARGALAGYLSHLALDATTPKGLPAIC